MKQLTKIQSVLYIAGGVMMVVGVGMFVFTVNTPGLHALSSWIFLVGTVLFAVMQLLQGYSGSNYTIKRLKRIQSMADMFFVFSGISMVDTVYQFFSPMFNNYEQYLSLLYNKWVVLLLIAAVIEIYTVHRIDHELKKESNC